MDFFDDDIDVQQVSDQRSGRNVLVDNGILVIEELKPPDRPQDRALRDYVDKKTRSIQPATGDQVFYRLKEARAVAPSDADDSPQVAVLGSSQVPVGLSSALGYLQLGQRARVKVPAELMEQAVDDTDAALHSLPISPTQPDTPTSPTSQTQTPRTTPAAAAVAAPPASIEGGQGGAMRRGLPAAGETEGSHRQRQAPAAAGTYTAAQEPAEAAPAPHHVHNGMTSITGGVVPPTHPQPVPQQQTLRERYQPQQQQQQQQQQGLVAALAAKYQQQPATNQVMVHAQEEYLATGVGAAGSSGVIKRADSDHSSWIPDSRTSSRTSHEVPTASGHIRGVNQHVGSRPVMTHRMPSASGWTSGTSSPTSDGSAPIYSAAADGSSAFHTPGGTSYHSAVSTPVLLTQRQSSSSGLDDITASPLVQLGTSNGGTAEAGRPGVSQKDVTSHSIDQGSSGSPEQCQSPELGSSCQVSREPTRASAAVPQSQVVGVGGSSLLGTQGGTTGQPLLMQSQQQQQGSRDAGTTKAAQSGFSAPVSKGAVVRTGSKVQTAYQTPDQVLQAAARKLELEQQQQQRMSFDSMLKPVEATSHISSMISSKRGVAGASRTVGGRHAAPSGPAAEAAAAVPSVPPVTQFVRVGSGSSDGAAGYHSGARSGTPSFKTWIAGRTGSTSDSAAMVSVAEEGAAAAATASGQDDVLLSPRQHSARPSIDRRMRYSGDYGSLRHLMDQEAQPPAAGGAGSSHIAAGGAGGADAMAGGGGGDQGGKKEYELEVLAIIPGRGKLSGKPVLSEAAQQQDDLDINGLARAAADAEPQFKPPKPQKGLSGWVRRHLSINLRSPASAGKRGMKWLGIRDCFKGSQGQQ